MWSVTFQINFGVRQGSVMSPYLFAVYLDDLGNLIDPVNGCYVILYADDILLLSPSVTYLERLLHLKTLLWTTLCLLITDPYQI